jgi:CUB domain
MLVTFNTDRSIVSTGFEAAYQTTVAPTVLSLDGNAVVFTSPNYPNNYENNIQKSWLINADSGKIIQLQFEQFDTERNFDLVKVES